jgi:hypothetical protein
MITYALQSYAFLLCLAQDLNLLSRNSWIVINISPGETREQSVRELDA